MTTRNVSDPSGALIAAATPCRSPQTALAAHRVADATVRTIDDFKRVYGDSFYVRDAVSRSYSSTSLHLTHLRRVDQELLQVTFFSPVRGSLPVLPAELGDGTRLSYHREGDQTTLTAYRNVEIVRDTHYLGAIGRLLTGRAPQAPAARRLLTQDPAPTPSLEITEVGNVASVDAASRRLTLPPSDRATD